MILFRKSIGPAYTYYVMNEHSTICKLLLLVSLLPRWCTCTCVRIDSTRLLALVASCVLRLIDISSYKWRTRRPCAQQLSTHILTAQHWALGWF